MVSHGMWLCPKTSTSVSGNRAAQRCSRPLASPGLVDDGEAHALDLGAGDLGQAPAESAVVVVAVHRDQPAGTLLEPVQQRDVHPVAGVHDDVGVVDRGPHRMR